MTILFSAAIAGGALAAGGLAYAYLRPRFAQSGSDKETDLVIESVHLDPPDGSTLLEQTPVHATIRFRFTKPSGAIGIWVRIFDDEYKSQYFGSGDRMQPGTHTAVRGAYLTEPGTLKRLTVVFKNMASAEIFRQDIPVNYTFVHDPALDGPRSDGAGSVISAVSFPNGPRATFKKGTFVPVLLSYSVNTPNGLFPNTIPDTKCSMTYAAMGEPVVGDGQVQMGFTPGEACSIKKVRVLLRNAAEGYVFDELVDVDLTVTD